MLILHKLEKGCLSERIPSSSLGTVVFCYEGRNTSSPDTDTAAVTINGNDSYNTGIRGIRFFYPESNPADDDGVNPYPFTIRLNGPNIYVVDVGFIISYNAIDAGTNVCNNHYIRNIQGSILNKSITVKLSDNSNGWIETVSIDSCMVYRDRFVFDKNLFL